MQTYSQISLPHSLKTSWQKADVEVLREARISQVPCCLLGKLEAGESSNPCFKLRPGVGAVPVVRAEGFEGNAKKPEVSLVSGEYFSHQSLYSHVSPLWRMDPPLL